MQAVELGDGLGWLEDIKEDGEIHIELYASPVSLQAKPERKLELKKIIKSVVEKIDYILTGDVSLHLEWSLHEQKRIETSSTADLDNILKPLIDALCGIDGVLIDDNQLDDIHSTWVTHYDYDEEKISITLNFNPSEILNKSDLVFVKMENNIYLPVARHQEKSKRENEFKSLEARYEQRRSDIDALGYHRATRRRNKMQRVFHVGRLIEYTKLSKEEYIE